jgi:hypothetical protein
MSTRLLAALSVVSAAAGLAAVYVAVTIWSKPLPDLESRPIQDWSPSLVQLGDPVDKQNKEKSFTQTFERPIFSQTRRPFVAAVAQAPPPDPEAPPEVAPPSANYDAKQFSLRGVLISGNARRALIASPESPDGIWVAIGSEIMGWKVANVERDGVKLMAKGQSAQIKLYVDNQASEVSLPSP